MPQRPDIGLVTDALDGNAGLTLGTNLFNSHLRPPEGDIPVKAVFAMLSGGLSPDGYLNGSTEQWRRSRVTVHVRGTKDDYDAGLTFARAVWAAINLSTVTDFSDVRCEQSEPLFIGEDDAKNPLWSINVLMWGDIA